MFDPETKEKSNVTFPQVSLSISLVLAVSKRGVKRWRIAGNRTADRGGGRAR